MALVAASAILGVSTVVIAQSGRGAGRVVTQGVLVPTETTLPGHTATSAAALAGGAWESVTSRPGTGQLPAAPPVPVRLSLPSIGLSAPVVPVGVEPGTDNVQVPPITKVGWYRFAASPGAAGGAVLVGHVDGNGQPGVFWKLRDLVPGARLTVGFADGSSRSFSVSGRAEVAKTALPAELFSLQGPARLALITCGGAFDRSTGHYLDNVYVVAVPTSP